MNRAENIGSATNDLERDMQALGDRARAAATVLAAAPTDNKQAALIAMAARIRASLGPLLAANAKDNIGLFFFPKVLKSVLAML